MPIYKAPESLSHQNSVSVTPVKKVNEASVAGNSEAIDQDAMMREIQTWIGTPYHFGMIEKGKGTDCSGFVYSVFKKCLNIDLPRQAADMYASSNAINKIQLKFGDLIFFQNTYKEAVGASHVGIYIGEGKMAHAATTGGVTISDLGESYYESHFLGCRRVRP